MNFRGNISTRGPKTPGHLLAAAPKVARVVGGGAIVSIFEPAPQTDASAPAICLKTALVSCMQSSELFDPGARWRCCTWVEAAVAFP